MNYVGLYQHTESPMYAWSGEPDNGALADLTIGAVYKILPTEQHERDTGMIRIIDNCRRRLSLSGSYFNPSTGIRYRPMGG